MILKCLSQIQNEVANQFKVSHTVVLGFLKRDVTYEAIFYDLTKNWIVCYYDVTYSFKSESTLYSFLNIKKLLARNLRDI